MRAQRRRKILMAVLSYASSNVDDINDALAKEDARGKLVVQGEEMSDLSGDEVRQLLEEVRDAGSN